MACAARFSRDSFVTPRVTPVSFAYLYCRVVFVCSSNKIRWAFSTAARKSIDGEYQYLAARANVGPVQTLARLENDARGGGAEGSRREQLGRLLRIVRGPVRRVKTWVEPRHWFITDLHSIFGTHLNLPCVKFDVFSTEPRRDQVVLAP